MDFTSDGLVSGRSIRTLEKIIEWRGNPNAIRCNNAFLAVFYITVQKRLAVTHK